MKCKICGKKTNKWFKRLFDDRHGYPGYFDVRKCKNCGFAQTKPQLTGRKITEIYENYYPWQNIDISKVNKSNYKIPPKFLLWRKGLFINGQYMVKPGSTVLDVGCGLGYSLLELESIGCKAFGLDPDKNALKLARKFELNFHKGFLSGKVFPKVKFDYIIGNQVIEHEPDPKKFLKNCKIKLKEGGKVILAFPNPNSITRHIFGKNWLHWHIPFHLNFFSKKSLYLLAEKSGLQIETLNTVTPNMWTNLQFSRLTQNPKPGERDTFWDGKGDNSKLGRLGIVSKIMTWLENYNFLNRIIDFFGFGESYVLTLSKSSKTH